MDEFRLVSYDSTNIHLGKLNYSAISARYLGSWQESKVAWTIVDEGAVVKDILIGGCMVLRWPVELRPSGSIWVAWATMEMMYHDSPSVFKEHLIRTLYRLGFEDEEGLDPLEVSLSAHEKAELHLSMPGEFWPQRWLGEEESVPT